MRNATCLFVVAACGTPTKASSTIDTHAPSPRSRPCPSDLAQRFQNAEEKRALEVVGCVAGNFPRPGWAAAYRTEGVDGWINLAIVEDTRK